MSLEARGRRSHEPSRYGEEPCYEHMPCASCMGQNTTPDHRVFATENNVLKVDPDLNSPESGVFQPNKRRRAMSNCEVTVQPVKVADFSRYMTDSKGTSVLLGISSTEALLRAVRDIAREKIGECELTIDTRRDIMLEGQPTELALNTMSIQILGLEKSDSDLMVNYYLDFSRGIFDLFPEDEVVTMVEDWHRLGSRRMVNSHVLLLLAIGARQRGGPGSECLAESLFQVGHQQAITNLMWSSGIITVQDFSLISIYLFSVCRRNAAFSNLGVAIRTAHALGLHLDHMDRSQLTTYETESRTRAWKCVRILDVQSCASLGRPLATTRRRGEELSEITNYTEANKAMSVEKQIDLAAFSLCSIAENILHDIYIDQHLTIESATSISHYLRQWAINLPGILINHKGKNVAHLLAQSSSALRQNHMNAAYFWTIILLTRPFLVNRIRDSPKVDSPGAMKSLPDSTFIDACINSSFRCLDVTANLLHGPSICKRLFLVVNTTMASVLVLGLATFGDFDRQYPLDEGIERAEHFLQYMAAEDPQAARSLEVVRYLRSATREYRKKRDAKELERQGELVNEVFGTIYAPYEGCTE